MFVEAHPAYAKGDFHTLKAEMLDLYDAARKGKQFTLKKLMRHQRRWAGTPMREIGEFKEYVRDFVSIGYRLLAKGKLTPIDYDALFICGLTDSMRDEIEREDENRPEGQVDVDEDPEGEIDGDLGRKVAGENPQHQL